MKPMTAVSQGSCPICPAMAIPGASNDQKLAAIITPAAKPSIESMNFRLTVFVKKTSAAPSAVTPHVKRVAISACLTGLNCWMKLIMSALPADKAKTIGTSLPGRATTRHQRFDWWGQFWARLTSSNSH